MIQYEDPKVQMGSETYSKINLANVVRFILEDESKK